MELQLYRRHSKGRQAKRPEDSRTGKFEEGRRNWKKGYTYIDQPQVTDMDDFYASWQDQKKGKARKF